jgi:hypothetical protein
MLELYRSMGRDVLRLAREKSPMDAAAVARLEALFRLPRTSAKPVKDSGKEPMRRTAPISKTGSQKKR